MELTAKAIDELQERLEREAREWSRLHHSEWPSVRTLARRYRVRQACVLDAAEYSEVLDICVGVQIPGFGHRAHSATGDYSIEYIGD